MSSTRPAASTKRSVSTSSIDSGGEEEKTIPFLRRLRDMLKENDEVISFVPGHIKNGHTVLGRIVVHDRIQVEEKVLPRYFNHASFASLRRQLNYFSFVRLGKGRQRESTYVNQAVVELDDVLNLRRRPAGTAGGTTAAAQSIQQMLQSQDSTSEVVISSSNAVIIQEPSTEIVTRKKPKRRRLSTTKSTAAPTRSPSPPPVDNNFVSEDERSAGDHSSDSGSIVPASQPQPTPSPAPTIVLDLTVDNEEPDAEVLAGCNALLGLASFPIHGF